MRRASRVKRLGHRADVRDQSAGLRGSKPERHRAAFGIEAAQRRACGRGPHRAEEARRVPSLVVIAADVGVAARELRHRFVPRGVGGHHLRAGCAQRLGFGQHGRNERSARMPDAALRHIVEIERMGSRAIDPCGVERGRASLVPEQRRFASGRCQHGLDQLRRGLGRTGDGDADRVRERSGDLHARCSGNVRAAQAADEPPEVHRQRNRHRTLADG